MTFFLHVRRNLGRNRGRTLAVILVVGITIGIFLVRGQVSSSVVSYTNEVVGSVPNLLTVEPGGGSIGGGAAGLSTVGRACINPNGCPDSGPLVVNSSALDTIYSTRDITGVQRVYFTPPNSGLISGSSNCQSSGNQGIAEDTTSPIKLLPGGVGGATSLTITAGRNLNSSDENTTNALIGQQYSTDNHLYVGDELTINGYTFHIVGIFQGSGCQGDIVIVPYSTGLAALKGTNPELVYVYVDSYKDVNRVASSLATNLGSSYNVVDLADVDHNILQNAISSILFSSSFGEYAALVAGAATIIIVMILVTTQRIREIGVLKALGYSGGQILGQILSESLILAIVGFPLALGLSLLVGPSIASDLLGRVGSGGSPSAGGNGVNPFLQNISFALTPETILLGAVITISFGLVGALYPAIRALLLRPTEALRHE